MIAGKIGSGAAGSLPGFRVGDERLIKLTSNAGRKVSSLLTKQGRPTGVLRVAVVGACAQDEAVHEDLPGEAAGAATMPQPRPPRDAGPRRLYSPVDAAAPP
mgnify:CR=1 FL=1